MANFEVMFNRTNEYDPLFKKWVAKKTNGKLKAKRLWGISEGSEKQKANAFRYVTCVELDYQSTTPVKIQTKSITLAYVATQHGKNLDGTRAKLAPFTVIPFVNSYSHGYIHEMDKNSRSKTYSITKVICTDQCFK